MRPFALSRLRGSRDPRAVYRQDAGYLDDGALDEWASDVAWLLAQPALDDRTRQLAARQRDAITTEQRFRAGHGIRRVVPEPGGVSRETIDEIRSRVDLADLVQRDGLALRRAGRSYRGLCPYHDDRHPSLSVQPDRGRWRCFGCNLGGDAIDWLTARHGLTFWSALAALAAEAGVELQRAGPAPRAGAVRVEVA